MSFNRLSIVTVLFLVALFLAGQVLAAVVASMTIGDQQIDLSVPNASVNITLSGDPNEAKTFNIPITITYDDGTTRNIGYTFNYQPPPSVTPSPSPACSSDIDCADGNACTYDSCIDGQCEYSNKSEGEVCLRDPGTYEPTKTCDAYGSCSQSVGGSQPPPSEPPPPPEPSCGDFEYKYWECDWGSQQTYDVYQDSCGNYDRRDYHIVEGLCGAPE